MRTLRMTGALLAAVGPPGHGERLGLGGSRQSPTPEAQGRGAAPARETPDCMYVAGWHLQENGPPIPFFELRCK